MGDPPNFTPDGPEPIRIIVEPAGMIITPDTYRTSRAHHDMGQAIMRHYGYDENDVVEVRLTEGAIEVDVFDRGGFVTRTDRHDLRSPRMSTTEQPQPSQPQDPNQPQPDDPTPPDPDADKLRPGERRVDVTDDGVTVEDKPNR